MKLLFLLYAILAKLHDNMREPSTEEQNVEQIRNKGKSIHSLRFKHNQLKNMTNLETKSTMLEGDDSHALVF